MLEALRQPTADRQDEQSTTQHGIDTSEPASTQACEPSNARDSNHVETFPSGITDVVNPPQSSVSIRPYQALPTPASVSQNSSQDSRGDSPSFYGATSHPHVVASNEEFHLISDDDDAVGIDLDPASPHIRDNLLQSFFKYQTLWVDIVDKESFFAHQRNGAQSQWYSRFLENAMLACGTRLSTSKSVRALGYKYCEWAKNDILLAMSEPTPANLQGFLLLSEYEVTQGNDRPGWMFCGVACRMSTDLGLHELASTRAARNEIRNSSKEGDLAYALLSACVVYEGVWTLYLGRPSSISSSIMGTVAERCKEGRKTDSPLLNAWVGLCVPMAQITQVLNEETTRNCDKSATLRQHFKQIEAWYEGLPPELKYDETRLSSMNMAGYGLHAQYCKLQILSRRALSNIPASRKRRHSQTLDDTSTLPASEYSTVEEYKFALRIARLVVTYRETFGMEKMPSIMLDNAVVAATAMVGHLCKRDKATDLQHETIWLRQLVKSMESVQPHFPITGRMLDSLKQIRGSGPLLGALSPTRQNAANAPIRQTAVDPPSQPIVDIASSHQEPDADSQQVSGPDQSLELGLMTHNPNSEQQRPEIGSDIIWDSFDAGIAPDIFALNGIEDFIFNAPASEAWMSSWPQSVA
ncbi:hypothetical protein MBLNU459_g2820t1 [Dothideomycetes sp. NU459]